MPFPELFNDLQAAVDLATEFGIGEVLRDEDRPHGTPSSSSAW